MGNRMVSLLGVDVGIQLTGFVISYLAGTEKIYDLAGSATYLLLTQLSLRWSSAPSTRQKINSKCASLWALRLGSFLFYRTLKNGDARFDKVKTNPKLYLIYWMVQAAWVYITLSPTLISNKSKREVTLNWKDYVGWGLFGAGFLIETIADIQKLRFRADPSNAGKFINTGLWSMSRHPNYFGEIMLWSGLFLSTSSVLRGAEWLSIASPIFVYYLLNHVSGIPILERGSLKRYGHLKEYQNYIKNVPILTPFFGKK